MINQDDMKTFTATVRAEAKAQAKIRCQELAEAFNACRRGDAQAFNQMARALNRLGVMVDVLVDLLADDKPLRSEGLAADRRKKFERLCEAKARSYEAPAEMSEEGIAPREEEPEPGAAAEAGRLS